MLITCLYSKVHYDILIGMSKAQFYTPEELAEKLKLNIITIYRYIRAKKIKAYKFGGVYRIDRKSFDKFINKSLIK